MNLYEFVTEAAAAAPAAAAQAAAAAAAEAGAAAGSGMRPKIPWVTRKACGPLIWAV